MFIKSREGNYSHCFFFCKVETELWFYRYSVYFPNDYSIAGSTKDIIIRA